MKPKVLLVDDEENVLQAYTRVLRGQFSLDTATNGEAALDQLKRGGPYAVLVSDMRMPGMDGVELLALAKNLYPETIRVMLTGNADQGTATEAVNQGAIFRFLNKPCESEQLAKVLLQAVRQYDLVSAEKALLEKTLKGSLRMLVDLLSMLDPVSFGRAQEMASIAEGVGRELGMGQTWALGIASILSQIGILTLPDGVATKIQSGSFLNSHERELANRVPEIGSELIQNIPRLEEVAQAILYMNKNFNGSGFPEDGRSEDEIPLGGRILRVVWDYQRNVAIKNDPTAVIREMQSRATWYDPEVIQALDRFLVSSEPDAESLQPRLVELHELRPGQVLLAAIETSEGLLVLPEGTQIGMAHLQKLRNFARLSGIRGPFKVRGG